MLRVAVLEIAASFAEPIKVLVDVEAALAAGPRAELVLLPEASLTGYVSPTGDFDLTRFAEPLDGPTSRALAALARRQEVVLVAPLVLREGEACFNAMVALDESGEHLFTYRKRHPWIPETWATPGPTAAPVITVRERRVTIAICYDLHFLEDEATEALDASDLLLFPSAWVEEEDSRAARFVELARRHRIAIANANWGRGVVWVPGQGSSSIVGADGITLACTPAPTAKDASRSVAGRVVRIDASLPLSR